MKWECPYGSVSLDVDLEGKIIVKSTVPFKKAEKTFKSVEKAKEFYTALVEEIRAIVEEMEKERAKSSAKKSSLFSRVLKLAKQYRIILLYGPTGTGKTFTCREVCKQLIDDGQIDDFYQITMTSGMEDIDLLGKFIPDVHGNLRFLESEFLQFIRRAEKERIAIIIDEFNRCHAKVLNILIPLLDEKDGKVMINNYVKGETITVPAENVMFLLTANFGASYAGTFQIDSALLNRVEVALHVDYQTDVEDDMIRTLPSDLSAIATVVRDFFREAANEGICEPFSMRDVKIMINALRPLSDPTADDIINALIPLAYKVAKTDHMGIPDPEFLEDFKKAIREAME